MWSKIKQWFVSKGGFNHVVAATFAVSVAAYAAVPPFAALLNNIYTATPAWAHQVTLAVLGLAAWYKNTNAK